MPSIVDNAQVASALVGLAWLFCLPAISLTTAELKPRSVYFDDTSMAPLAAKPGYVATSREDRQPRRNASFVVRPDSGAWPLEAIALVANDKKSVPLALDVAEYVAKVPWLSRNLLVVVDESPAAFLDAYYSSADMDRGGLIRAALVLEDGPTESIRIIGANGALPNMDLLALFTMSSSDSVEGTTTSEGETYWERAEGILTWISKLLGGPTGAHSLFLDRGVDALTVVGADPIKIEVALRSLNNLEHQLHHSFFMYWLASPKIFVSINEYAWPIMLLVLPLALAAHRHLLVKVSSTILVVEGCLRLMVAITLFLVRAVPIPVAYLSAIFLLRNGQHNVVGLVCAFWAYVHAALLLPQPAVALVGALAVLPLSFFSRDLDQYRLPLFLWWLTLFFLILLRILPALDQLEYDYLHYNDQARYLYVRGCLLPMHAAMASLILNSKNIQFK